jgi:hypothetical protein
MSLATRASRVRFCCARDSWLLTGMACFIIDLSPTFFTDTAPPPAPLGLFTGEPKAMTAGVPADAPPSAGPAPWGSTFDIRGGLSDS